MTEDVYAGLADYDIPHPSIEMGQEQENWLVSLAKGATEKLMCAETLAEFSEAGRIGLRLTEENLDRHCKEYLAQIEREKWVHLHIG